MLDHARSLGINRAGVIGAGLMGRRIAGVLASGGLDVVLYDANDDVLNEAVDTANLMASKSSGAGVVRSGADLRDAVANSDFVTEAIVEDLAIKQTLFEELSTYSTTAILASNTSVLPITQVAARATNPERVVGTHWWNPPDLIPIVEVIRGERTSNETMDRTFSLLENFGKLPVRVEKDVAGFVGNRLQHALWREAIALVADGVCDAETVDLVCRNTIGLRLAQMGPIETADYVGLDLTRAIHDAVLPSLSTDGAANPILTTLIDAGSLGAKSGQGFLTWSQGRREQAASDLAAHVKSQLTK